MAEVPSSADVVVVGGGVIGLSALYHLVRTGDVRAVLLERDTLGSGSTAAAAGGIRAQFSDELNVRIAVESMRSFERFADEIGADIGFRRTGYLFLLHHEHVAGFERAVRLQQSLGVASELLTIEEASRRVPLVDPTGLNAAAYCASDGLASPASVVQGYAAAARRLGATIVQHCSARRIGLASGRIAAVHTDRGTISTERVVCAAGVWSGALARTVGLRIPVCAERRYVYYLKPSAEVPAEMPLTVDFATSLYFHREGPGLILGGPWPTVEDLAPVVERRLPGMADSQIAGAWSGLYEMSPDHNAVVGRAAEPDGFVYAAGFSGHGFQQAPAIGAHLADLTLDRQPALSLDALSLERFSSDGRLRLEAAVI